jgi:hypothetical protein
MKITITIDAEGSEAARFMKNLEKLAGGVNSVPAMPAAVKVAENFLKTSNGSSSVKNTDSGNYSPSAIKAKETMKSLDETLFIALWNRSDDIHMVCEHYGLDSADRKVTKVVSSKASYLRKKNPSVKYMRRFR